MKDGVLREESREQDCLHCDYHLGDDTCDADSMDKPEGIAVELIDGCIRLLDAAAAWGLEDKLSEDESQISKVYYSIPLPELMARLHRETANMTTGL